MLITILSWRFWGSVDFLILINKCIVSDKPEPLKHQARGDSGDGWLRCGPWPHGIYHWFVLGNQFPHRSSTYCSIFLIKTLSWRFCGGVDFLKPFNWHIAWDKNLRYVKSKLSCWRIRREGKVATDDFVVALAQALPAGLAPQTLNPKP